MYSKGVKKKIKKKTPISCELIQNQYMKYVDEFQEKVETKNPSCNKEIILMKDNKKELAL